MRKIITDYIERYIEKKEVTIILSITSVILGLLYGIIMSKQVCLENEIYIWEYEWIKLWNNVSIEYQIDLLIICVTILTTYIVTKVKGREIKNWLVYKLIIGKWIYFFIFLGPLFVRFLIMEMTDYVLICQEKLEKMVNVPLVWYENNERHYVKKLIPEEEYRKLYNIHDYINSICKAVTEENGTKIIKTPIMTLDPEGDVKDQITLFERRIKLHHDTMIEIEEKNRKKKIKAILILLGIIVVAVIAYHGEKRGWFDEFKDKD